jgi:hypothetical protein
MHLHIQVVEPGVSTEACWDRNYANPATWDTTSPLIGSWTGDGSTAGTAQSDDLTINTDSSSGVIGTLVQNAEIMIAQYEIDVTYSGQVEAASYGPGNSIQIVTAGTTSTVTRSTYPGPVNLGPIQELSGSLSLDSVAGVSVKWTSRTEFFTRGADNLLQVREKSLNASLTIERGKEGSVTPSKNS